MRGKKSSFTQRITVKASLYTFIIVVFALINIQVVMSFNNLTAISEEVDAQKQTNMQAMLLAEGLRYHSAQVQQWYTDVSTTGDPAGYQNVEEEIKSFRDNLKQLEQLDASAEDHIQEITAKFESFNNMGRKMSEVYMNEGREAGNVIMESFDKEATAMAKITSELVTDEQAKLNVSYAQIQALTEKIQQTMLISLLIIILVLGYFAYTLIQKIIPPLNAMAKGAFKYSQGDFRDKIAVNSNDELGVLAKALNAMGDSLRALIRDIMESSKELSSKSQELAASCEEYTAIAEEVASTTTEVMNQSENSNESIVFTISEGEKALNIASEGNHAVNNTVSKIDSISNSASLTGEIIKELGELSNQIGSITEVMTDIADQTNLLALNAAIEAARAGEHGKGFAVVAEEVRKLAEQSNGAAKEIGALVKQIQVKVNASVTAIDSNLIEVSDGTQLARQAGEALGQILASIQDIVDNIKKTGDVVQFTNKGMYDLNAANDQVACATEQTSSMAQQLANLSATLQALTQKFKIS